MNRMSRSLVAGALAAVVALGVTAPAAVAAPKDGHSHVHKAKAHKAHKAGAAVARAGKAHVAKADRRTARVQRQLTRQVSVKERFLTRLVASKQVTTLPLGHKQAVSLSISTDLSELADLKAAIAGGQDVRTLSREVRAVRPATYLTILGQLRWSDRVRAQATAVGVDTADLDAVVTRIHGFDARTSWRELQSTKRALVAFKEVVEAAEDAVVETPVETPVVTPEVPTTEEPVSGDPVVVS